MNTGVYEILNTVNGKRYVGSAVLFRTRFAVHRHELRRGEHHSKKLQNAWDKYGQEAFVFRKLFVCAKDMLTFYEQRAIDTFNPEYNILKLARSSLGYKHAPEALARMSKAQRSRPPREGRPLSEETKQKIGDKNRGRVVSESTREKLRAARAGKTPARGMQHSLEARAKMSAARKGKPRPPEAIKAGAAKRRGVPRSPETKAKLSALAMGRQMSAETRRKISDTSKGRKRSPEAIAKMVATKAAKRAASTNALRKATQNE